MPFLTIFGDGEGSEKLFGVYLYNLIYFMKETVKFVTNLFTGLSYLKKV